MRYKIIYLGVGIKYKQTRDLVFLFVINLNLIWFVDKTLRLFFWT